MRLSVMKNIKKHAAGIIALTILVSMLIPAGSVNSANSDVDFINPPDAPGFSYAVNSLNALPFSDVRSDDWFIEDLKYILNYGKGIFSGYPDGTFRPADTLTTDMYIKLIVTAMGHSVENGKEYWASTYIKKAIDEGYVVPDEDIRHTPEMLEDQYYAYKQPINRGEMAMFTARALSKVTKQEEFRDPLVVSTLIKDYKSIPNSKKTGVVKCYDVGIITGYPDGEFKADNILTRAEAVAVIRRVLDPSARKKISLPPVANPSPTPVPVSELERPQKKELDGGVVEVEGIKFDPETDVWGNGAMKIMKAEEFVHVALKYLRFYEHEGKARVKGYVPELPEGFEWDMAIAYEPKEQDDRGYWGGTYFTKGGFSPEQTLPGPGNAFDKPLYTNKENIIVLVLVCDIKTANTNIDGGRFFVSFTAKEYSRYDSIGGNSIDIPLDAEVFFEW
jgi:hypothetical protein